MDASRRRLLKGAAALASVPLLPACKEDVPEGDTALPPENPGPATPDRPPEPPPWEAPGTLDEEAFPASVQAGDATADGVILSVRTFEDAVELVVVEGGEGGWTEVHREALSVVDGGARLELSGLPADTVFRYAFYAADGTRRSRVGRFRTALADGPGRKVVFGATSCLGSSNPAFGNLEHAAALDLDLFLLLGDTVYADGSETVEDYRVEWLSAFATPSLAALSASTSVIATWDDHEVDNNWYREEVTFDPTTKVVDDAQLAAALSAFREAVPQRTGPGGNGLWRSLRWGDVLEIFVLDSRGERDAGETIVSEAQLEWIVEGLAASTATFKIVMASVHLTDHRLLFGAVQEMDRWQGYPAQRGPLVDAMLAVDGVLVVTGDMHYAAIQRLGPSDAPENVLYEVAAGPSGSKINLVPVYAVLPEQYPVVVDTWSFCRFEADPGAGTIRVTFIGDDGAVLAEEALQVVRGGSKR